MCCWSIEDYGGVCSINMAEDNQSGFWSWKIAIMEYACLDGPCTVLWCRLGILSFLVYICLYVSSSFWRSSFFCRNDSRAVNVHNVVISGGLVWSYLAFLKHPNSEEASYVLTWRADRWTLGIILSTVSLSSVDSVYSAWSPHVMVPLRWALIGFLQVWVRACRKLAQSEPDLAGWVQIEGQPWSHIYLKWYTLSWF